MAKPEISTLLLKNNYIMETGQSTEEGLKNFTLAKGCLVIADRVYGTIKNIEHCPTA